jgi:quinol monooxygenase YgiN
MLQPGRTCARLRGKTLISNESLRLEGDAIVIIIAGYSVTEADKRDAAVEAFAGMVERARKYDGCLDLSISADPVDPDRINLFESWRDEQSWNAWRKIAKSPRVKLRESFVKLYRCDGAEKSF